MDVGVVEIGRNNHGTRVHVDEEKPPVAEEGLGERGGKMEYCSDEIFVVKIKVVTVVVGLGVQVAGREHECFGGVYKDDLRWNETKEGTVGGKFGSEEYVEVRRSTTGSDSNQKEQYHSRTFG